MIKPVHPFRFARIERLRELLEPDSDTAVDLNAGVSTTELVRPDPPMLDAGLIIGRDPGRGELGPSLRAMRALRHGNRSIRPNSTTIWKSDDHKPAPR